MAGRIKTCSESPLVCNSSTSYTFKSSCEAEANLWHRQRVVLLSKMHEIKFVESCEWRKSTLMPVFKIRSFKVEDKERYPKNAELEAERVEKLFINIK